MRKFGVNERVNFNITKQENCYRAYAEDIDFEVRKDSLKELIHYLRDNIPNYRSNEHEFGNLRKEEPIIINIPSVDSWTITDLKFTCRKNKIKGYTKMSRDQLIIEVKRIIENIKEE